MKFKIIKLTKPMKETPIPKGYRLAKCWEFLKYVDEGFILEKAYWYYTANALKNEYPHASLVSYRYFDDNRLRVNGSNWDDDYVGYAFGVFVKVKNEM
jgi:hypothetical protein